MNSKITLPAILVSLSTFFAESSLADNSGITLTPSIGYMDFYADRNPNDDAFASIGLGYKFNSPWQLELVYGAGEYRNMPEQDFELLRLDAFYHLDSESKVTPYLAFGVGHAEFERGAMFDDDPESNANVGGGLKIALSDMFALRPDVRLIHEFDNENTDVAVSLGLQFLFGGSNDRSKERATTPKVVADTAVDGDADADGVSDSRDQCPATPKGVQVSANGCPLDDDNDGVPNHLDNCPGSGAGAKVDAAGCYILLKEARSIELDVKFANNSAAISDEYLDKVSAVADFLRQYPATDVVIEGHTDSSGSAAYNKNLSERRASSVARTLIDTFNIDAGRVSARGYGEERPVADNDTAAGKAKNRRVVAVVSAVVEKRAE